MVNVLNGVGGLASFQLKRILHLPKHLLERKEHEKYIISLPRPLRIWRKWKQSEGKEY